MSNVLRLGNQRSMSGNNVSHSKRRTRRTFKPNLVKATITIDGIKRKVILPARMLKSLSKAPVAKSIK